MFRAITICFILAISTATTPGDQISPDFIYKPNILEDYRNVDYEVQNEWENLYETILAGYGYLKQEAEDELKKAVSWVNDYYENVTSEYEKSLYDFEQTYITNSDQPDYEFLYDIEQIVYDGLDDLEVAVDDSYKKLEDEYWLCIEALDKQQDDIENILEISESRVDDIMDGTEADLEKYVEGINQVKWDLQDVEDQTSEDIDDDIVDYYEDDEDSFGTAELAAINELQSDLSAVEDFDSAPTYKDEYEQKYSDKVEDE